jgi:hypothetical protein
MKGASNSSIGIPLMTTGCNLFGRWEIHEPWATPRGAALRAADPMKKALDRVNPVKTPHS